MKITGLTKIFFMIADPIDHVRTPEVINPRFEAAGIDAVMVPLHIKPQDFPSAWAAIKRMPNVGGVVVSVPMKDQALELSDVVEVSAEKIGVANVIRRDGDSKMVAANLDGLGFIEGMLNGGRDAKGQDALLLGAGGAGRAISISLADCGVASLRIFDVDFGKARDLVEELQQRYPDLPIEQGSNEIGSANLVINATPLGLHPETDALPLNIAQLRPGVLVADIVMKPRETPLLIAAKQAGCEVRYGAGMLDSQIDLMMKHFGY